MAPTSSDSCASDTVDSTGTRRSISHRQISWYDPNNSLNCARFRKKHSAWSDLTRMEAFRTSSLISACGLGPVCVPVHCEQTLKDYKCTMTTQSDDIGP